MSAAARTPLQMLVRCRVLREEAAQRAQAHAAEHARRAQAAEAQQRQLAADEAARQLGEQGEMLDRVLSHDVLPQALGKLMERHIQRRDTQAQRVADAARLRGHMDKHLDYARRMVALRARAVQRADALVEESARAEEPAALAAVEALDDDYTTGWSHGRATRAER